MKLNELDQGLKSDLMASFENAHEAIEEGLSELEREYDPALIHELFRSMHSIKGNAAMIHVDRIVNYAHAIENVFSRIRDGKLSFTPTLSEALQVGMDRLRDLHHQEILGVHFENLNIDELSDNFSNLSRCTASEIPACIGAILNIVEHNGAEMHADTDARNAQEHGDIELSVKQQEDLTFFQELSLQLDRQIDYWEGRSIQCFDWAQKLNQYGGSPVRYEQLAAASYVHDFGMLLIPHTLLQQNTSFGPEENKQIRPHPFWGHKLLRQMSGWDEAAEIVLQHHEYENGKGYPNGLSGDQIHTGAKILAIIDAFVSMTAGRADRAHRRSALRAISEINARKGTQFSAEWVNHFNHLLKAEIHAGRI